MTALRPYGTAPRTLRRSFRVGLAIAAYVVTLAGVATAPANEPIANPRFVHGYEEPGNDAPEVVAAVLVEPDASKEHARPAPSPIPVQLPHESLPRNRAINPSPIPVQLPTMRLWRDRCGEDASADTSTSTVQPHAIENAPNQLNPSLVPLPAPIELEPLPVPAPHQTTGDRDDAPVSDLPPNSLSQHPNRPTVSSVSPPTFQQLPGVANPADEGEHRPEKLFTVRPPVPTTRWNPAIFFSESPTDLVIWTAAQQEVDPTRARRLLEAFGLVERSQAMSHVARAARSPSVSTGQSSRFSDASLTHTPLTLEGPTSSELDLPNQLEQPPALLEQFAKIRPLEPSPSDAPQNGSNSVAVPAAPAPTSSAMTESATGSRAVDNEVEKPNTLAGLSSTGGLPVTTGAPSSVFRMRLSDDDDVPPEAASSGEEPRSHRQRPTPVRVSIDSPGSASTPALPAPAANDTVNAPLELVAAPVAELAHEPTLAAADPSPASDSHDRIVLAGQPARTERPRPVITSIEKGQELAVVPPSETSTGSKPTTNSDERLRKTGDGSSIGGNSATVPPAEASRQPIGNDENSSGTVSTAGDPQALHRVPQEENARSTTRPKPSLVRVTPPISLAWTELPADATPTLAREAQNETREPIAAPVSATPPLAAPAAHGPIEIPSVLVKPKPLIVGTAEENQRAKAASVAHPSPQEGLTPQPLNGLSNVANLPLARNVDSIPQSDPPSNSASSAASTATVPESPVEEDPVRQTNVPTAGDPTPAPRKSDVPSEPTAVGTTADREPRLHTDVSPEERLVTSARPHPAPEGLVTHRQLELVPRQASHVRTHFELQRVEVQDPDICDVIRFSKHELVIVGKRCGTTYVRVWFQQQDHSTNYLVTVRAVSTNGADDLSFEKLATMIQEMFPRANVDIVPDDNRIIVQGTATSNEEAIQILTLVRKLRLMPVIDRINVVR